MSSRVIEALLFMAILFFALCLSGCDSGVLEGVAIGVGTSQTASEAEQLAQKKKTALVAEIIKLRNDLANADPEQKSELEAKLASLERKQEMAELTSSIADTVRAGIERDWGDKAESPDNLAWILGSAATILGGYAGKKTIDDRKKAAAINRVKIASKAETLDQGKVYSAIGDA
jgi:hypothetical protein